MGAGSGHHFACAPINYHKEHYTSIPLLYCRINLASVLFVMFAAMMFAAVMLHKSEKAVQFSLQTCLLILVFKLPLGSGSYSELLTSPEVIVITSFGPIQTHH